MDSEKLYQTHLLSKSGEIIDNNLSTAIRDMPNKLSALKDKLRDNGFPELADKLEPHVSPKAGETETEAEKLANHVDAKTPGVMDKMSTYAAYQGANSMLTGENGCQNASEAFGPMLGGREAVTAAEEVDKTLDALPDLNATVAAWDAELASTRDKFFSGEATQEELSAAEEGAESARAERDSAITTLEERADGIDRVLNTVDDSIAREAAFEQKMDEELRHFGNAMRVNALYNDQDTKAVLGAIGSDKFITLMNK